MGAHHYHDLTVANLMSEATILGNSYVRAGNQTNPDDGSSKGANTAVTRNVVMGGVTVALTLVERAGTNLATTASATTTATSTSTTTKTVWWDGAAGDYTVTVNGAGVVGSKQTTTDPLGNVRNYVTITGMAVSDVITCTRAGGATNTHLQIEEVDAPTSKIALSGTRSEVQKKQTGMAPGDNGTIVALFQPYGWSNDFATGQGYALFRVSTGAANGNIFLQKQTASLLRLQRVHGGGTSTRDVRWNPKDGVNRLVAASWSLTDVSSVRVSGRECGTTDGFSDAASGTALATVTGTTPVATWTSLEIGSRFSLNASSQCNGWIALLYFSRVLTQDEVDQLAFAFEGQTRFASEITAWGDSETAYSAGNTFPDKLITSFRPCWRNYNAGVGGETCAQIQTRFLAHPRKWRGFTIIWSNNTPVLATIQAMVALLGHTRYLVLSQLNDATSQQSGTAGYNTIIALNASLASAFGANYFDCRAYLITLNNGGGDAADTTHDCIGTSQRSDSLHLNSTGQLNLATKIDQVITAMGYPYP